MRQRDDVGAHAVERHPARGADHLGERSPLRRVIMGIGSLAQIVQQRRDQEQVGPADLRQETLGLEHRLDLVAVHGEAVHGGALGSVADLGPARRLVQRHQAFAPGLPARSVLQGLVAEGRQQAVDADEGHPVDAGRAAVAFSM